MTVSDKERLSIFQEMEIMLKIGVEFENVGKKQLLLKFAKFTVVE